MVAVPVKPEDRFWARVNVTDDDGCWEWLGSRLASGYGMVYFRRQSKLAHRVAWEIEYGPIPTFIPDQFSPAITMSICHRCDNRVCARPSHLFLGTPTDNMRDMTTKGRHRSSVLTAKMIDEIRARHLTGETSAALARDFGVSYATIRNVVTGRSGVEVVSEDGRGRVTLALRLYSRPVEPPSGQTDSAQEAE